MIKITNLYQKVLSMIIMVLFILPHTLVPFIPPEKIFYYYIPLLLCSSIFFLYYSNIILFKKDPSFCTRFVLILISSVVLTFLVKGHVNTFDLIFPLISYCAYKVILNKDLDISIVFIVTFVCLYILFYFQYYSIIPGYFHRPHFNEEVFYGASSNVIPIALNNTLFAYMILNFLFKSNANKSIFIISLINLLLIIIQQSRVGIVIAIILVFIALYHLALYYFTPSTIKRFKYIYAFIILIVIFFTIQYIIRSSLDTGQFGKYYYLDNEKRAVTQMYFFKNLNLSTFFFGYSTQAYYGDFSYTFNIFLDFWNKYNFLSFFILISFIFYRIFIRSKKYFFPNHFLIPFLCYGMLESIYLPMFWDFMIYLILFLPKEYKQTFAQ